MVPNNCTNDCNSWKGKDQNVYKKYKNMQNIARD